MIPAPSLLPTSQDYGEAWRAQLRLAGLARTDQNTQARLNSTPIAERRPWWRPAERKPIPFRKPTTDW